MRALGIDPGSRVTGWAVVERTGGAFRHVDNGLVRLRASAPIAERLAQLLAECQALMARFGPTVVVLERNFVARNVQSAFRIGEARGVVLAAAATAGIPISEHAPAEVKLAAVGHGGADKTTVARGIAARLGLPEPPAADAADAVAVALCWLQQAPLRAALVRAGARPAGVAR